jgi:hypothetical protein
MTATLALPEILRYECAITTHDETPYGIVGHIKGTDKIVLRRDDHEVDVSMSKFAIGGRYEDLYVELEE